MANLTTNADIIADILFRAGEPTDGTSDFDAEALRVLNRAYKALWMGGGEFVKGLNEPWLWLKKDPPGTLTLQPIDSVGTLTATNNSTAVTLSATRASSLAGWFLKVDERSDVFRVATHTAGTASVTLDSVYTGPGGAGLTFTLSKLEYDLAADLLRLISPMRVQSDGEERIEGCDLVSLDRDYPLIRIENGTPTRFALVTETKVRFNKSGGLVTADYRRVEYDYLQKPSDLLNDSGSPLVPIQYRQLLSDMGLFYLFTSKADQRAEGIGLMAKAGLNAMAADNRARTAQTSHQMGSLLPRPANIRQFQRVLRVG